MKKNILFLSFSLLTLYGLIGCGSSEAIESYQYATSKQKLELAVNNVLKSKTNIIWDSVYITGKRYRDAYKNKDWYVDTIDTMYTSQYRETLFWITVKDKNIINNYEVRYWGDSINWNTSATSVLFISSINNNYGLDLRQGENVSEFSSLEAKNAIGLFEKEFIAKLDAELKIKHVLWR